MPDLNALLRWAVENSTSTQQQQQQRQQQEADSTSTADPSSQQQLALRFRPTNNVGVDNQVTLHPSDPYFPRATDTAPSASESPVSTAGPLTPIDGEAPSLPGAGPAGRRNELTTEILDLIMGRPDSLVMKEKMEIATDESKDVDERVEALDDFEMLIEMIDNANNMAILKLWDPLLSLLQSPEQAIVRHACWICGTAVQNNLKGQAALYVHNALPLILSLIYPTSGSFPPSSTRAKATYALSSALKHWPLASSALSISSDLGFTTLRQGVADSDPIVRRKMAFLVGTLIMQSGEKYEGEIPGEVRNLIEEKTGAGHEEEVLLDGLKRSGVIKALVESVTGGREEDVEFDENAMRALSKAGLAGALTSEEKSTLKDLWDNWGVAGQAERGLDGEDGAEITRALSN